MEDSVDGLKTMKGIKKEEDDSDHESIDEFYGKKDKSQQGSKRKLVKKETVLVERTPGWFNSCYNTLRTLFIVALLILLAAIGGYWSAHTQTQKLEIGSLRKETVCEVDRANWGADKRQIEALHTKLNECEKKLTNINKELKELTERYNEVALEKKGNVTLLAARDKEEIKAIETCQEKLMNCNALYGGVKTSELRLESENKELKNKIAQYQELINTKSREQQQKNQHSRDGLW